MRKLIFSVLFLSICLPPALSAKSGITASFHSGSLMNGTSFGIKLGPFNPYAGFDIIRISAEYDQEQTYWDTDWDYNYYTGEYVMSDLYKEYEYNATMSGSATLIIPQVGCKFYLGNFYIIGGALVSLPTVSGRTKGERTYWNSDGTMEEYNKWNEKLSKKEKESYKDALDFFGVNLGIGAEYFISPKVSIGGEFGVRLLNNQMTDEDTDSDESDGSVYWKEKWQEKISTTLGVTYTSFSLNFIL